MRGKEGEKARRRAHEQIKAPNSPPSNILTTGCDQSITTSSVSRDVKEAVPLYLLHDTSIPFLTRTRLGPPSSAGHDPNKHMASREIAFNLSLNRKARRAGQVPCGGTGSRSITTHGSGQRSLTA